MRALSFLFFSIFIVSLNAQNINENLIKYKVGEKRINISSIDYSPKEDIIAIASSGNPSLIIYDWNAKEILKEIEIPRSNMGYSVKFSKSGDYLILQEQQVIYSPNKVRETDFIIVELSTAEVKHHFTNVHDAKISNDELKIVLLQNDKIKVKSFKSGETTNNFDVENALSAMALSPDGNEVIVAHKPYKKDLENVSSIRDHKKAIKPALKYRQMLSTYDLSSGEKLETVNEVYDIINALYYNKDGSKVLCYSIPHTKINNVGYQGYINIISANSLEPSRESYLTRSSILPDFDYSRDQRFFAISLMEKHPVINVYDANKRVIVDSFDSVLRFSKHKKEGEFRGSNASFSFISDLNKIVIGYGNTLIEWELEL